MNDDPYRAVFEAWRDDPGFRAHIEDDPKAALAAKGVKLPCDEVRVVVDTPQTFHIVFPADPNAALSDEALGAVAGGTHDVPESDYYRRMKGCYWSS